MYRISLRCAPGAGGPAATTNDRSPWVRTTGRAGCIGGGGQPYGVDNERRNLRIAGLYQDDRDSAVRCSHENPEVTRVYEDFLGKPLGPRAHELLHTRYPARPLYKR